MEHLKEVNIKTQEIDLINGFFSATEAADVINALIDSKINFHKIKKLSITEGNQNDDCFYDNGRIVELIDEKEFAKQFFSEARLKGKRLKMESVIKISIEN